MLSVTAELDVKMQEHPTRDVLLKTKLKLQNAKAEGFARISAAIVSANELTWQHLANPTLVRWPPEFFSVGQHFSIFVCCRMA
jgi:hypothetical protein